MIEIAPDIYYIAGKNNSRFPYCACLYLTGKKMRVLIDAGMGGSNIQAVKRSGIDVLILSHCHIDHRLTRRKIANVPVWCHEKEAPYLRDKALFLSATGIARSGFDLMRLVDSAEGLFDVDVSRTLADGETIDLGGLTLVILHTAGHSPGHLAFYIPEHRMLFSADVDLTSFGPFYGHDFADIDDFSLSIDKLKRFDTRLVATGHAGPFEGDPARYFDAYKDVIHRREHQVLAYLNQPRSLAQFKGSKLIFKSYPEPAQLIQWFELVHIEKHLKRLASSGKVRREAEMWYRI